MLGIKFVVIIGRIIGYFKVLESFIVFLWDLFLWFNFYESINYRMLIDVYFFYFGKK